MKIDISRTETFIVIIIILNYVKWPSFGGRKLGRVTSSTGMRGPGTGPRNERLSCQIADTLALRHSLWHSLSGPDAKYSDSLMVKTQRRGQWRSCWQRCSGHLACGDGASCGGGCCCCAGCVGGGCCGGCGDDVVPFGMGLRRLCRSDW